MKSKVQNHSIESAFVLVLFAVFAIAVAAVLALGAGSYKKLAERDNEAYNKRIIISYISAKLRSSDETGTVKTGGFAQYAKPDGIDTLHLYQTIEGEVYDMRIYYYDGYIYELFTTEDNEIEPEAGNPILEAGGLSFVQEGALLHIVSVDAEGRENQTTVYLRSEGGEVAS